MRRREFIALVGGAAVVWPHAVIGQQSGQVRQVGVLGSSWYLAAFKERFQKLGWKEGQNVHVEYRFPVADPQQRSAAAAELAKLEPDVLLAPSIPEVRALLEQTHHTNCVRCHARRSS
jgi:putative ABC transport system substrate-binding protein